MLLAMTYPINRYPAPRRFIMAWLIPMAPMILMIGLIGLASGHAWADDQDQAPAQVVADEQQAVPSEARLRERVEARWAALAAGDYDKAYGYETPGYRATVSSRQYRSRFGGAVSWRGAKVSDLTFAETGDRAEVKVRLTYEAPLPTGETYTNTRPLRERWISAEGDWWHVRD